MLKDIDSVKINSKVFMNIKDREKVIMTVLIFQLWNLYSQLKLEKIKQIAERI